MAPPPAKEGASGRRKSINLFSLSTLASLTQINTEAGNGMTDDYDKKERKKPGKRASLFSIGPIGSPPLNVDVTSIPNGEKCESPKTRPRTLQKGRPLSVFGSLGKRSINNEESEIVPFSTPDALDAQLPSSTKSILYHGEIQTTNGMFRKKKEYLVLTETHLIRFKSQSRASDSFPSIPSPPGGRSNSTRQTSSTSVASLHEAQSTHSHTSLENENRIPLAQVVTVYKVEDGRPFMTTEVVFVDEEYHGVGNIQLILHDPKEADLWHTSIRMAAEKARLVAHEFYPRRVVDYLVTALEKEDDYDSAHFQVFRVVRRISAKNSKSSDDFQKLGSSVFYMVVGINRIHLIPVPDFSHASNQLVSPKNNNRNSYGIVSLVDMRFSYDDDRFEIAFRNPLHPAEVVDLAASATPDIAVSLLKAWRFLKPLWEEQNFNFSGPRRIIALSESPHDFNNEEIGCFDRTLVAYCLAYKIAPANIQYAVDWDVEDAPEFQLWPARYSKRYSPTELLAVMRALRYNEFFQSISFKDIDLHGLHGTLDLYGNENVAMETRSGISLQKYFNLKPQDKSLLYQEIQALALKSSRLRKMDFTNTLPRRRPKDNFDIDGKETDKDPGCEIIAALLPLCQGQITNVTWIVLSGIELGETDLESLIPGLHRPQAQIRAIECSRCGLTDRGIMQLVTHLERQNATLELIDISGNPGRIGLQQFQGSMSRFTNIRSLNLSRTSWTTSEEPLILPEVLITWILEELILNGVVMNEQTIDSISTYLASNMSDRLRLLQMDQCNLSGEHVALLMHSMVRDGEKSRELEFHVSANRLEKGVGEIVKAIKANRTPTRLFLRMIEFTKEDHFRQLLRALRTNTTIRCLDISKASLPYDAGPETCECLRSVFADNRTLEELDISGEQAHLEVTRFGIGLNHALTGLKRNQTLRLLRIEYQNLGLEGANTLASVIEENTGLTHVLCEHNDINLQGFTTLVNALAKNTTILEMPFLQDDQNISLKRMNANIRETRRGMLSSPRSNSSMRLSMQRTLHHLGVSKPAKPQPTPQDLDAVVRVLNERWEYEMGRLRVFLKRNNRIAAGYVAPDDEGGVTEAELRPTTALSDGGILEQALGVNPTPNLAVKPSVEEIIVVAPSPPSVNVELGVPDHVHGENEKRANGGSQAARMFKIPSLTLSSLGNEKLFGMEDESALFLMDS